MKLPAYVALILFFASPYPLWAVGVSGRFTTAAYTFERDVPDSLNVGQLRFYQTGSLAIRGLGSPHLSFQTSLRTSLDLLHRAENDPSTRLYHAFFRWTDANLTVTGGRQFVSAGVGVGTLDGVRVSFRPGGFATVDAYAGTLSPLGRSRVFNGWDDGHMAGIHVISSRFLGTTLGASFYRRTRRVKPYWSKLGAAYPDSIWVDRVVLDGGYAVRPNALEQQMAGLDLQRSFAAWSLYGRLDLSAAGPIRVRRGDGELRFNGNRTTASLEYLYRTPWTPANSIFSIFTQRPSHEATGRGDYRFSRHWGVSGEFSGLFFDGRGGYRASAGISVLNGYVGYTRRRGYGGTSDGIDGDIRRRLTREAWVSAGGHYESFRYEDGIGPRSAVLSGTLGLNLRPVKYLSLSIEGQGLSQNLKSPTLLNAFPGFRRDLRFFFRASVWFFHGEKIQGMME